MVVGLSLKTLYEAKEKENKKAVLSENNKDFVQLTYNTIVKTNEVNETYYDLCNKYGEMICCDGEENKIINQEKNRVKLRNVISDKYFYLSNEEFNIAYFDLMEV